MSLSAPVESVVLIEDVEDARPHPGRPLGEDEFVAWCGPKTRAEWVDGEVILMPPASFGHVSLNDWLVALVRVFISRRDLGIALSREFFVRFPRQRRRRLPDLLFVAKSRLSILRETYCDGAPDLIMEVVSPESESRDWRDKYLEYERAGVHEYWIIDPMSRHVEAYALENDRYVRIDERDGKLISRAIPGFFLRTQWLWQSPLPDLLDLLPELGVQ